MRLMKYFYCVTHAVDFPISEYGGIWNVIAENDDECFDLISSESEYKGKEKFYGKLRENIINADKFPLQNEEESKIVTCFVT